MYKRQAKNIEKGGKVRYFNPGKKEFEELPVDRLVVGKDGKPTGFVSGGKEMPISSALRLDAPVPVPLNVRHLKRWGAIDLKDFQGPLPPPGTRIVYDGKPYTVDKQEFKRLRLINAEGNVRYIPYDRDVFKKIFFAPGYTTAEINKLLRGTPVISSTPKPASEPLPKSGGEKKISYRAKQRGRIFLG